MDLPTVAAFVADLLAMTTGLAMWLPTDKAPSRSSDLGAAIVGGAVVALSVIAVESSRRRRTRQRAEERHRREPEHEEANRQRVRDEQLRITLNL